MIECVENLLTENFTLFLEEKDVIAHEGAQVPDLDGSVFGAAGEEVSVRRKLQGGNPHFVARKAVQNFS